MAEMTTPLLDEKNALIKHLMQENAMLREALKPFAEPHFMGDNYVKFAPRLIEAARRALSNEVSDNG